MSLRDVNWGAVIIGAAAVTAIVAMSPGAALMGALLEAGATKGAVLAGAAVVGGIVGNMTSKLFERAQDTVTTAVGR